MSAVVDFIFSYKFSYIGYLQEISEFLIGCFLCLMMSDALKKTTSIRMNIESRKMWVSSDKLNNNATGIANACIALPSKMY